MAETFAERLRALRTKRMLTQRELAEKIGTDWHVVQRWENGSRYPRPSNQRQLCEALSVEPSELFSERTV